MSSPDASMEARLLSLADFLRRQFGTLEEAFSALDTEGLQRLSAASFSKSLMRLGYQENIDEVFQALDCDGLNAVTHKAFMHRLGNVEVAPSGNMANRLQLVERSQQLMTKLLGDMNKQLESFSSKTAGAQGSKNEIADHVRNEVGDVCQKLLESCQSACAATAQSAKSACAKLTQNCSDLDLRVSSIEDRLGSTEGLLAAQVAAASEDTEPSTRTVEPEEPSLPTIRLVESLVTKKIAQATKDNRDFFDAERTCVTDKMEALTQEFDKMAESRVELLAMVTSELQSMRSGCMDMSGSAGSQAASVSFAEAEANSSRQAEFLWEGGSKSIGAQGVMPRGLDQVKLLWEAVQGLQKKYDLAMMQFNELRRSMEAQPTMEQKMGCMLVGYSSDNGASESQVMPGGDTQTIKYVQESVRATQLQLEALRLNLHEIMKDTSMQSIRDLHDKVGAMQQQVKDVPSLQMQVADLPGLIAELPSMQGLCSLHEVVANMQRQIKELKVQVQAHPPTAAPRRPGNDENAVANARKQRPSGNQCGSYEAPGFGRETMLNNTLPMEETRPHSTQNSMQCTPGATSSKNTLPTETTPGPARRAVSPAFRELSSPMGGTRSIADELAAMPPLLQLEQRRPRKASPGPRQGRASAPLQVARDHSPVRQAAHSPSPLQGNRPIRAPASPQPASPQLPLRQNFNAAAEDVILVASVGAPRLFNSYSAPARPPVSPLKELRQLFPTVPVMPMASGSASAQFPTAGLQRSPSQPGTVQALLNPHRMTGF